MNDYRNASHIEDQAERRTATENNAYPAIDWDYWLDVNPDIIAWVCIPNSNLSYPVLQAPKNDPQYYLFHDVYGNWNFMGCPYLDADCNPRLEENSNSVIYGHNLGYGDTSMFATVASYIDPDYARKHQWVILQTPRTNMSYQVVGAKRIQGSSLSNRVAFDGVQDFISWKKETIDECEVKLEHTNEIEESDTSPMLTLCTCSYSIWSDERTLLFAIRPNTQPD